jgi:hypothetical protein
VPSTWLRLISGRDKKAKPAGLTAAAVASSAMAMKAPPKLAGLAAGRTGNKRNCIKENCGDGGRGVCPEILPPQLIKKKR